MIIDSHCHLNHVKNIFQLDDVISNAINNNVNLILNISTKKSEFNDIIEISKKYQQVYFTLGVHPHEASEMSEEISKIIYKNSKNSKFLGIGETGLDYYYNHVEKNTQIRSFENQIEIAQDLSLPIIVHMRDAEDDIVDILKKSMKKKKLTGVIHCFTGTQRFADEILELGFYISASGIITFKKSDELRHIFSNIPNDKLLVETDSPYLSPVPLRGKTNQPSNIVHTITKLAQVREVSSESLVEQTNINFLRLFDKVNVKESNVN